MKDIDLKTKKIKQVEKEQLEQDSEAYWERYVAKNRPYLDVLIVDLAKIFNKDVWQNCIDRPLGAIQRFEEAVEHITNEKNPKLRVRFINVAQKRVIRNLRHKDAKKLIAIPCLVKRITQVDSKVITACFRCESGHEMDIEPENEVITKPAYCMVDSNCKSKKFKAVSAKHHRVDRQFLFVQDLLDDLDGAVQPATLRAEVIEDLCNKVCVGDRVILNGVLRLKPRVRNGEITTAEEHFFEVNSIEVAAREYDSVVITDEDEKIIKTLAAQPDIFKRISDSVATSILGMELVKSSIALLLFGGVTTIMPDGLPVRGDINMLVVSDPGMAKTQLLKFTSKISPRGVFANATTSSKVGLVASVQKDEVTGQWCIDAGAYMLASGGTLCLDEISELKGEELKMVNEAMENGEAHISKAGINTTVKTKASLLAACNPEKGRFVEGVPLQEQLKIDPSVLSRFDIVVLLRDFASKEQDTKTAEWILQSRMDAEDGVVNDRIIPPDMLRKYIAYAKRINPKLTKESNAIITGFYVETRPAGEKDETIAITTRQVPSLARLAEAHARMRLSPKVEKVDADLAVTTLKRSLYGVAFDIETGKIDEDRISNKTCKQSRNFKDTLVRTIQEIASNNQGHANEDKINESMTMKGYDIFKVRDALFGLSHEGVIMQARQGLWRVM